MYDNAEFHMALSSRSRTWWSIDFFSEKIKTEQIFNLRKKQNELYYLDEYHG